MQALLTSFAKAGEVAEEAALAIKTLAKPTLWCAVASRYLGSIRHSWRDISEEM
jgi:hypothetical protein